MFNSGVFNEYRDGIETMSALFCDPLLWLPLVMAGKYFILVVLPL